MRRFRKIVVGIDLGLHMSEVTPGTRLAADQALRLAERVAAHVTLVHSSTSDEYWDDGAGTYVLRQGRMQPEAHTVLEQLTSQFREHGIPTDLVSSDEDAWLAITRQVLREGADLVLVGKRTEQGDPGRRLGSVTLKLLRKCPCAVWAVKPGSDPIPKTVLAATDRTLVGRRVVEIAASLAAQCGSKLHVVHAFQMPISVQMDRAPSARLEFEESERAEAEEAIQQQVRAAGLESGASLHIGLTSPARAILECVDRLAPDLVVMGTLSRGGIPGVLVGNTAERLLLRLDCSLLTVKPEDFVCPVEVGPPRP